MNNSHHNFDQSYRHGCEWQEQDGCPALKVAGLEASLAEQKQQGLEEKYISLFFSKELDDVKAECRFLYTFLFTFDILLCLTATFQKVIL